VVVAAPAPAPIYPASADGGDSRVKVVALPPPPSEEPQILVGYEISMPLGSLQDYVSDASFRGFEFGALWPIFKGLYLGPVFNHHTFYEEKGFKTYELDSGAVTANLYSYARFWTMAGAARYHFLKPDSVARPYLGLRMGMTFVTASTMVADLSIYDTPIGFALSPEVGVLVRLAAVAHLSASIRYDFTTASSGRLENGSYMAYQLGFTFHRRQ
jgi:hypothetical protein